MQAGNKCIKFIALAGILFSGYLSAVKLFSGNCPLTEGCAYLFGIPTCVYGFVMFLGIFIAAWKWEKAVSKDEQLNFQKWVTWIAGIGILFSGYYAINEILFPSCLIKPCTYALLLPSCVYGLVMYVLAFWLANNKK